MKPDSFFLTAFNIHRWQEEVLFLQQTCPCEEFQTLHFEDYEGGVVLAELSSREDFHRLLRKIGDFRSHVAILALIENQEILDELSSQVDDFLLPSEKKTAYLRIKAEKLCAIKKKEFRLSMLEKEILRHQGDLKLAKYIQDMILTEIPPSVPNLEIDVKFRTTGLVGGDLCDFQMMSNQHLGIFLADVSGHGIGSALIASMTKILFKTFTSEINNPKWFISNLNSVMVDILMPVEKFITAFYGIYHNYKLTYVNAGHISPFVYSPSTGQFRELLNTSCILGYIRNIPMSVTEITVQPDDVILFYTDGLVEAKNRKEEMFSSSRLQNFVKENHQKPQLAKLILSEVEAFAQESRGIEDDMTLVVVKVR